jgi:mannan endo-1,4-beta-mannosidase
MKRKILLISLLFAGVSSVWSQGFTISGTQLIDANGKNFIMRGFAVPLAWFVGDVNSNIANIRQNTNANCLRIVVQTYTSDADWQNCVTTCIANNMIPEVELHDQTCGTTLSGLASMANWWVSKKAFLTKPSIARYILINIANEWGDWNMAKSSPASWRDAYKNAVSIMRKGGISTTLVIDAPDCGQDLNNGNTLKLYAKDVFNSDSLKNCLFTLHLYGEWCSGSSSPSKLATIKAAGIPMIVGEFADQSSAGNLSEMVVMDTCEANEIGWMAWSWKGNNEPVLDMSYDWAGTSLTPWGNIAVNNINGLKNTAQMASVFTGDSNCTPTPIIPYIKINGGSSKQVSGIALNIGDSVVLSPQPDSGGSWKWIGPNGFSSTSREVVLNSIQPNQSGYYIATFTNGNSCISSSAINISVAACKAAETSIISGATYKILSKFSGKAVDVSYASTDTGALVIQMSPADSTNQEWLITNISNSKIFGSYWEIASVNSGKALNVLGASTISGTPLEQMTYTAAANQKWQIIKDTAGYFQVINVKSSDCLDIMGLSTADGASLIQGTCITDNNQKFAFIKLKDPVVNITDQKTSNFSIFPNPNNGGQFMVTYNNVTNNPLLEIFDEQGKLVYKQTLLESNTTINSGLTTGIYILKVSDNRNSISQKLAVK